MLNAKTLHSWTFKAVLIWIAGFGALVIAPPFVYSSTASYVPNSSDRAIDAERTILAAAYRDELIATIISQIETISRTSCFDVLVVMEVSEAVIDLYVTAAEDKDVKLALIGEKPIISPATGTCCSMPSTTRSSAAAMSGRSPSRSAEARPTR